MKILIKFLKLQLSPNARLNQDTKVWNQIERQRIKISFKGGKTVIPRVMKILIKFLKLQLSPNARLNQDTKF
jgi:predicted metal-dependent hydrolase